MGVKASRLVAIHMLKDLYGGGAEVPLTEDDCFDENGEIDEEKYEEYVLQEDDHDERKKKALLALIIMVQQRMKKRKRDEELSDCEKEYNIAGFPGCIGSASTQSAMRKALIAASAVPVDNRRGKKRRNHASVDKDSTAAASSDLVEDLELLTKTLEYLSAVAMEREEKKYHQMCARIVRDKLAARRRRSKVLLRQLALPSKYKKRPDATLFDEMESNEEEIEKLEHELATLQEREFHRQREMMEKRCTMSCVATMIGMNVIVGTSGSFESSGNDSSGGTVSTSNTPRNERKRNDGMTLTSNVVQQSSDVGNVCMECEVIPTNHLCLKCKVVRACAYCCDENRALRNVTWCKGCFESETPITQQIIRDGDYNYK